MYINNFSRKVSSAVITFVMALTLVQFPLTIEKEHKGEYEEFVTFYPPASLVSKGTAGSGAARGWKFPSLALYPNGLDQYLHSLVGPLFGPYSQAQHNFPK